MTDEIKILQRSDYLQVLDKALEAQSKDGFSPIGVVIISFGKTKDGKDDANMIMHGKFHARSLLNASTVLTAEALKKD